MKRLIKVILALLAIILILSAIMFIIFAILTKDNVLDENKLTNYGSSITVCDNGGNEITNASLISKQKSVELENLNEDTVNAFIASEDRTFFTHNGINYKRMAKALYKNITSRSFKEGASTISQQLIKNTHLTGDKTIKRKLSEIKLTRQLENKYTKEQILEMYLNTIYFGHNCYGLECAAEFYFGETAPELTLEQSATMAGLLTSPNNYSPFKNAEKCIERRNIVLKNMYECGYIDRQEYINAQNTPLSANKTQNENTNDYITAVFDELEDLGLDNYSINEGCIIKTYLNKDLQKFIENLDYKCGNSVVIMSNKGEVKAYKSTINGGKRQPGSTIKPLLVYAPAIEEKLLLPATKILDEKVNYNGYSPENYDKKYHGYVTLADSLKYSYNIPAVKTLNALTVEKANKYANMYDIALEDDEKNLSLALGGMKYGLNLKEICEKYSAFCNKGIYHPAHFIKEITQKNGKIIYKAEEKGKKVFSEGTSSLMNEMLIQTTKEGTAKKLKKLPYEVASKTGTCGNNKGNTDAYCISYTSSDIVGIWLGNKDNNPISITGGNDGAKLANELLKKIYENKSPANLDTLSGTVNIKIDRDEYNKNNKIILADTAAPAITIKEIKVPTANIPKQQSSKFSNPKIEKPTILMQNNTVIIKLCQTYYYYYLIDRVSSNNKTTVYDDEWIDEFIDTPQSGIYEYFVTPYYCDGKTKYYGETIKLPAVNIQETPAPLENEIPDIVYRDWYNE